MPIYDPCIILKQENAHISKLARIDSFCKLECGFGLTIGDYVHIASFCHLGIGGGTLFIEDYAGLASHCCVATGTNSTEGMSMSASAPQHMQIVKHMTTILRRFSFLGMHVTILPGITVGEYAIVGAGSVVTKDIPPYEKWAGVPAKKIGMRDDYSVVRP